MLAARKLGYKNLPVRVKQSKRITSHGEHISDVLYDLLYRHGDFPKSAK